MEETLKNYMNAVCEVKNMNNELFFQGRLKAVSRINNTDRFEEDSLAIDIYPVEGMRLPIFDYDIPLKINILNTKLGTLTVGGRVYIANNDFWRISSITAYNNFERRSFFRVNLSIEGKVEREADENGFKDVVDGVDAYPVKMIDISLSGVFFAANAPFSLGDKVKLSSIYLVNSEPPFNFDCTIIRIGGESLHGILYGCEFDDLGQKESDRLCRAVFALQREAVKKRKTRL